MSLEIAQSLVEAIKANQGEFGLDLTDEQISAQEQYFRMVSEHNPMLHLVAPGTAEDFAVRHILESIYITKYFPERATFSDIGTGAGLPAIPCLLYRKDISAYLVESKNKKAVFLENAVINLGIEDRAKVINKQFNEMSPGRSQIVTCRAIDKFTNVLPNLVKWANGRQIILMAGPSIAQKLQEMKIKFVQHLIPMSEQRLILIIKRKR